MKRKVLLIMAILALSVVCNACKGKGSNESIVQTDMPTADVIVASTSVPPGITVSTSPSTTVDVKTTAMATVKPTQLGTLTPTSKVFVTTTASSINNSTSTKSPQTKTPTVNSPTAKPPTAKPPTAKPNGESFPVFKSTDSNGKIFENSIFSNNKVTLVNYWATWCGPCISELSDLQELHIEVSKMGGAVFGIVSDASDSNELDKARNLMSQKKLTYVNIANSKSIETFVSEKSRFVPTSFFVDSNGYVIGKAIIGSKSKDEYLKLFNDILR